MIDCLVSAFLLWICQGPVLCEAWKWEIRQKKKKKTYKGHFILFQLHNFVTYILSVQLNPWIPAIKTV